MNLFTEKNSVINKALEKLEAIPDNKRNEPERYRFIISSLRFLNEYPQKADKLCVYNIERIGESFIQELSTSDFSKDSLDHLFACCLRFIIEADTTSQDDLDKFHSAFAQLSSIRLDIDKERDRQQDIEIKFAKKLMPILALKKVIDSTIDVEKKGLEDKISYLEETMLTHEETLSKRKEEIATIIKEQSKTLLGHEEKAKSLESSLKSYEYGFNFVGLSSGFENLLTSKNSELKSTSCILIALSIVLTLPPFVSACMHIFHEEILKNIVSNTMGGITFFSSIAAIEILFLFYFRIFLSNFRSIKSQILQIELRRTLCRFIQSYADYAQKIRTETNNPLEKFESLIFSGLVASDDSLPTTFDGLDKIADLIKKVKSSG